MQFNSYAILTHFGRNSMREGNSKEAAEYFQRSLSAAQSMKNEHTIATALLHLGDVYQMEGDLKKSESCYLTARDKYLRLGSSDKAANAIYGRNISSVKTYSILVRDLQLSIPRPICSNFLLSLSGRCRLK